MAGRLPSRAAAGAIARTAASSATGAEPHESYSGKVPSQPSDESTSLHDCTLSNSLLLRERISTLYPQTLPVLCKPAGAEVLVISHPTTEGTAPKTVSVSPEPNRGEEDHKPVEFSRLVGGSATPPLPRIIQGGMGIGVSNWKLARVVSMAGQLGVVSGTALTTVFVRRLQLGDLDGRMRHALAHCPLADAARRIQERYFIPDGKAAQQRHRLNPLFMQDTTFELNELTVVANFVEIFLAKEGHAGVVGLNLLEKIQLPTMASLFGAILAGVDYVLMGAGIPRSIPGTLDRLVSWETAELKLTVAGADAGREFLVTFDPKSFAPTPRPTLRRPAFLAIVSSATLAMTLARKSNGQVDGFVVEGFSAGGHNAPPRGGGPLSEQGEPVYGIRDIPDLKAIRELGRPFWLAGSYATKAKLAEALAVGATGVQIGTAFAFCEESGLRDDLKAAVIRQSRNGELKVQTDPRASPTGMPFKVVVLAGTVADPATYAARERLCDLGYLRQPYQRSDGRVGYRCPAEPVEDHVAKGGTAIDAEGRKCLCNGLFSAVGLGQAARLGGDEPAIVTAGDDAIEIARFLSPGKHSYHAIDVLESMLGTSAEC
jgi:nitronate monooxygenase